MLQLITIRTVLLTKYSRLRPTGFIFGLLAILLVLEYATPADYVFGYLYIGPILLANSRLNQATTLQITLVATVLTMLNLWVPGGAAIKASTVANRLIAVMALFVTGVLSTSNRRYQEALAHQQSKLKIQEQLNSVREDFASTLTHDLKTPMLGAIETLKAFQQERFGPVLPTQQKVLATMVRSYQTSLQLVETLLDVYRNDIEGLKLQLAPVDLVALAEEMTETLTTLASARRINLSLSSGIMSNSPQCLWVYGDALQLQRVFANLLTNAINHSLRGGQVEIVLEHLADYQVVKILDTGAGVTVEELPHLFERFYQGHSARQTSGSGLGLYLSRQIIEAHGGTIWAENRFSPSDAARNAPLGAVFGFSLPAHSFKPL